MVRWKPFRSSIANPETANPETAPKGREPLGKIKVNGIPVLLEVKNIRPGATIETPWAFDVAASLEDGFNLGSGNSPGWIMRRIYDGRNLVQNDLGTLESSVERADGFIEAAETEAARPFTRDEEFARLQTELAQVMTELERTPGTAPELLVSEFATRPRFEAPVGEEEMLRAAEAPAPLQSKIDLSRMPRHLQETVTKAVIQMGNIWGVSLPGDHNTLEFSQATGSYWGEVLTFEYLRAQKVKIRSGSMTRPTVFHEMAHVLHAELSYQAKTNNPWASQPIQAVLDYVDSTKSGQLLIQESELLRKKIATREKNREAARKKLERWKADSRTVVNKGPPPKVPEAYKPDKDDKHLLYLAEPWERFARAVEAATAYLADGTLNPQISARFERVTAFAKEEIEAIIPHVRNTFAPLGNQSRGINDADRTLPGRSAEGLGQQNEMAGREAGNTLRDDAGGTGVPDGRSGRPARQVPVTEAGDLLRAAPAPQSDAVQTALASMPPIWRSVLQASMRGDSIPVIATREKLSETAIGNILRLAKGKLNVMVKAQEGQLKPAVQMEDGQLKGTKGRPDLALGAVPNVAAVDQNRAGPEEVTHAEMQDLANRMLAEYPEDAERLVIAWMDSGTVSTDAPNLPRGLRAIVAEANARQAAQMLLTATAKLLTVKKATEGGDMVQMARFIDSYRNAGTEQARALGMRRDPFMSPAERHAMFIAEAMLTPPESVRNEMRQADNGSQQQDIRSAAAHAYPQPESVQN